MDGCPNVGFAYVERGEIYDDMGFPITDPYEDEGYDINGWPVNRVAGVIIDGELTIF